MGRRVFVLKCIAGRTEAGLLSSWAILSGSVIQALFGDIFSLRNKQSRLLSSQIKTIKKAKRGLVRGFRECCGVLARGIHLQMEQYLKMQPLQDVTALEAGEMAQLAKPLPHEDKD